VTYLAHLRNTLRSTELELLYPSTRWLTDVFLFQGRALLNAVGNLGVTGAYGAALTKLGVSLEDVADAVSGPKQSACLHLSCLCIVTSI
jgi:hypothetical protein